MAMVLRAMDDHANDYLSERDNIYPIKSKPAKSLQNLRVSVRRTKYIPIWSYCFSGLDPNAIKLLPPSIIRLFPFSTTGLAKRSFLVEPLTVHMVVDNVVGNMSFDESVKFIRREHDIFISLVRSSVLCSEIWYFHADKQKYPPVCVGQQIRTK